MSGNWLPYNKISPNSTNLKTLILNDAFVPPSRMELEAMFTNYCSLCLDKYEQRHMDYFGLNLQIDGSLPALLELHLDNNKITSLSGFENTPNLTHLYLGHNEIPYDFFNQFMPESLTHLHLESNSIKRLLNFTLIMQLEELVLDDNKFERLCSGVKCETKKRKTYDYELESQLDLTGAIKLRKLSIGDNTIRYIDQEAFIDLESLQILNLSGNVLKDLPIDVFGNLTNLQSLALSRNLLKELPDIDDMDNLETLLLDGNQIELINSEAFSNLPKLKTLNIANNGLIKIAGGAFDALTSLNELDLSGNKLIMLPSNWITGISLNRLHLDRNLFTEIESMSLANVTTIEYLSIAGNPLVTLSTRALMELPEMAVINIRRSGSVNATGGEDCSCQNMICPEMKFKVS
uniref:LRRCT domain-containing protein n=1 Tax=Bracon brevicornis TaxID=1563983 RepID=A0A6V7KV87_9HYME